MDIYRTARYIDQALASIPHDHPHTAELLGLLESQFIEMAQETDFDQDSDQGDEDFKQD